VALSAGQRLGPFEILSAAGAGGMGEVYKAKDTRLDRMVAIKVLPSHLAGNAELRQRFEREARAVSSLNHPHVCALYDVGHQDGVDFLVLEYVEGETLETRLQKGPLPPDQLLRTAIEIASALDAAHRRGIIHRDLKPGNIMMTKAGAKLLDFGLAKAAAGPAPAISGLSVSPTETRALTAEGSIVGTFQYLSPEQLEEKEADARTDLFAFGLVLYEMATGRKAFTGKSRASVIAAILSSEPRPISEIQPMTPPALDRLVKRCLAKDPEDRWQSARDLALELKWIAAGGSESSAVTAATPARRARERIAWAMAGLFLLAFSAALAMTFRSSRSLPASPVRFEVPPPEKISFNFHGMVPAPPAISPDGKLLVFGAQSLTGENSLWIRPLGSFKAQPLSGTDDARYPFWSPDSRFVGFFAHGKLKKILASGGPAQTLCDAKEGRGGAWSSAGVILFAPEPYGGLSRVPEGGGTSTPVTHPDPARAGLTDRWPTFLPDGRHFLYLAWSDMPPIDKGQEGIFLGSLESGKRKLLLPDSSNVAFSPPGHLLFVREGALMAMPFDPDRLEASGEPIPVADKVEFDGFRSIGTFSVSAAGQLVYLSGSASSSSQLTWFDRAGKEIGKVGSPAGYRDVRLSPDGKRAALTIQDPASGATNLWVTDLTRGTQTRFTFGTTPSGSPVWSPDGSRILFTSREAGHNDLYLKASSGAGDQEILLKSDEEKSPVAWSPDSRVILFNQRGRHAHFEIWAYSVADRKVTPFLQTQGNTRFAKFSPDGRWVAYVSDESGKSEVYVRPFPGPGGQWQISPGGGLGMHWRGDGKELIYGTLDRKLMAVEVKTTPTFEAGTPKPLFQAPSLSGGDITADHQRFLLAVLVGDQADAPLSVVLNWTTALKR